MMSSTSFSFGHSASFRDAEMTIKIVFERSSQKRGGQGVRKEGQQGTHLRIFFVGLKHRKNSILERRMFIVVASSQEIQ